MLVKMDKNVVYWVIGILTFLLVVNHFNIFDFSQLFSTENPVSGSVGTGGGGGGII
jgi:hypothetical protein